MSKNGRRRLSTFVHFLAKKLLRSNISTHASGLRVWQKVGSKYSSQEGKQENDQQIFEIRNRFHVKLRILLFGTMKTMNIFTRSRTLKFYKPCSGQFCYS